MTRLPALPLAVAALLAPVLATTRATADDAGAPAAAASDAGVIDAAVAESIGGCVEKLASGATRPGLVEEIPARAASGYAVTLTVAVTHKPGESVLAQGAALDRANELARQIEAAHFAIPDQTGPAKATVTARPAQGDTATTIVEVRVVPLPEKGGRSVLVLPSLPIAVARANGDVSTLCTKPHTVVVEDPIANVAEAKPIGNPPPRSQREEWTTLKDALGWGAVGVAATGVLVVAGWMWSRRPRPAPPPPPPRPPWEVALEKLDEIRAAGLLETGRFAEYFDRVSDAIRGYLGARYGFDGLESTTAEIKAELAKVAIAGFEEMRRADESEPRPGHVAIERFLEDCDLVKFANVTPTREQCEEIMARGEEIVLRTTPPLARPERGGRPAADAKEARE